MTNDFRNIVAAELVKLRTLPATLITTATTMIGTAVLAAVFAAGQERLSDSPSAAEAAPRAVEYRHIGFILLGILAVVSE
ncbi:hypothetical protein [Nonomuraea sp. NPDC049607]|uniref:hypothetical protein n=1 Tax=Nonomuraea sp. NPDC049607 TaxID=3154732 RepID=UPI003422BD2F